MGQYKEFTSKKQGAKPPDPPAEITFKLDGEPFTALLRTDADSVLEWSELAGAAAESEEDIESAEGAAFVSRFFRLMLPRDEYRKFRAHMKANQTDPDVLVDIMQHLNERMEAAVENDASRPTQRSSSSSPGRAVKGERTAKIISLSGDDGDIEYVSEVPTSRVTRNQRRRQAKRRAG